MSEAELRTTEVDLAGLMTVLGEHLYSTPLVAIRELVQNAHDSCTRRRIESANDATTARITLRADAKRGTITVTDNGAGLTHDEIIKYLATVGAGYTRRLRQETSDPDLIGMFGLGFLSAFVVAESVSVWTTSYQSPHTGHRYRSRTAERYTLEAAPARDVGTEVELQIKPKFADLVDEAIIASVLTRYCAILPHAIFIGDEPTAINATVPPWRTAGDGASELVKSRERLAFAARFERHYEPLVAWDVTPSEDSDVRGLVWVQSAGNYATTDSRSVAVFVRGMLLDDDARDLLPAWAGFAGAVVESSQLTPTASREDLQRDSAYRVAARVLVESLVKGMAHIAKTQPELWQRVLLRHNDALLGAAIADDRLFNLLADVLTLPTSEGDLTLPALLRRGNNSIHVALSARGGFEEILFRALKVPIVTGARFAVLPFLKKCEVYKSAQLVHLGTEAGDRTMFRVEPIDADERAWLESALATAGQAVVATRFEPRDLPLVLVPDQEVLLKRRLESDEANKRIAGAALRLARLHTANIDDTVTAKLYVNLDSPAIEALRAARKSEDAAVATRARVGADLLRAFAAFTTGTGEASAAVDIRGNLEVYTKAVCALFEAQ